MIVFWHWRLRDAKRGRSSSGTSFCVARHMENGDGRRVNYARLLACLGIPALGGPHTAMRAFIGEKGREP